VGTTTALAWAEKQKNRLWITQHWWSLKWTSLETVFLSCSEDRERVATAKSLTFRLRSNSASSSCCLLSGIVTSSVVVTVSVCVCVCVCVCVSACSACIAPTQSCCGVPAYEYRYNNEYTYHQVEHIHAKPITETHVSTLHKPLRTTSQQKGFCHLWHRTCSCGIAIKRFRKHNFWNCGLSNCHSKDAPYYTNIK